MKDNVKAILFLIFILVCSHQATADTWASPKIKDYYNTDSTFYARIVPTTIPDKYSQWRNASIKKKKKFSPKDTLIVPCYAIMYKRTKNGDSLIWQKKLINRIAPMTALVSSDGSYLVTFDNWSSLGYGVDVMAYYDRGGNLIKRHMLEDISPFPINTFRITTSSIWWSCGQKFIDYKRIQLCFIDEKEVMQERTYNLEEKEIE